MNEWGGAPLCSPTGIWPRYASVPNVASVPFFTSSQSNRKPLVGWSASEGFCAGLAPGADIVLRFAATGVGNASLIESRDKVVTRPIVVYAIQVFLVYVISHLRRNNQIFSPLETVKEEPLGSPPGGFVGCTFRRSVETPLADAAVTGEVDQVAVLAADVTGVLITAEDAGSFVHELFVHRGTGHLRGRWDMVPGRSSRPLLVP